MWFKRIQFSYKHVIIAIETFDMYWHDGKNDLSLSFYTFLIIKAQQASQINWTGMQPKIHDCKW